ncbi:MAG: NAD(P)/FAD-dependent oxidoreductase [Ginsengibacter sp.]
MPDNKNPYFDVLIAGSGFAGSLAALALKKSGLKVCLLEKGKHPRFAIGESSTPIADMILRRLSRNYDLPWLYDFSRYGSWQKAHPEIVCGIKRGFSFFKHFPKKEFFTDENHLNELLVAASTNNELSDTNWFRSDFDAFLVTKVKEEEIDYFDGTEITNVEKRSGWIFSVKQQDEEKIIKAKFFIDATGSGDLLENFLGIKSSSSGFLTNSFAVFSHFDNVPRWTNLLKKKNIPANDFPYDPDFSALHQILDEGWMWMLRFNNELTSIGFVLDGNNSSFEDLPAEEIFKLLSAKYPSVSEIFKDAKVHSIPGKIFKTKRLQRKLHNCFGEDWVALPHSDAFVDPLFSPGIAFSLSGLENVLEMITEHFQDKELLHQNLQQYENQILEEVRLMDALIAGCYKTFSNFSLFNAWSMLYFIAAIANEQRLMKGKEEGYFLNAHDSQIQKIVYDSFDDLKKIVSSPVTEEEISSFTKLIKERIAPYNIAGLLDPSSKNMYHHTVAVF